VTSLISVQLRPEEGDKVIETDLASLWMDDEGILYSKSKKQKRTLGILKKYFSAFRKLSGGKKTYMIADVNEMQNYSGEEKDYLHKELTELCKGVALICCKPVGKMMATIAILKKKPPFPARIFEDTSKAKAWILSLRSKK
jgi:hypothetical protein